MIPVAIVRNCILVIATNTGTGAITMRPVFELQPVSIPIYIWQEQCIELGMQCHGYVWVLPTLGFVIIYITEKAKGLIMNI